jgi:hypothetical protein
MAEIDRVLSGYVRELTPSHVPDFENIQAGARRRARARAAASGLGVAAVALTVFSGVAVLVGAQRSGPDSTIVVVTAPATSTSPTARQGRLRTGGAVAESGAASCANAYSPRAVADRAFAFDGTVVRVGPGTTDRPDAQIGYVAVTFTVHEWFRGGTSREVTADMTPPPTSTGDYRAGPSYESGRLMESGLGSSSAANHVGAALPCRTRSCMAAASPATTTPQPQRPGDRGRVSPVWRQGRPARRAPLARR